MEGVILSLTQFFREIVFLLASFWQQYPITIGVILFLAAASTLWQSWEAKKLQKAVDKTIDELVDRTKTSRDLFLRQLRMIGIIDENERLILEGKYGPGIASESSLAKIVARLMLDRFSSSGNLARDIVDHFMSTTQKCKFKKRRGNLEAFWYLVDIQFSDVNDSEINEQELLDGAIARRLGHHLRQQDLLLSQTANNKEEGLLKKRYKAFKIAYGAQKTPWRVWVDVMQSTFWGAIARVKSKAPAKADSL